MKIKDNLTVELKLRVTDIQKQSVTKAAKASNLSTSDFLRNIIFEQDTLSSQAVIIRQNLIKNELHNHIQASPEIPNKYKEIIYKEMDKID